MRIAVDADPIGRDGSGNETYLRGLLEGMAAAVRADEEMVLFGSRPEALTAMGLPCSRAVACRPGLLGDLTLGPSMRRHRPDAVLAHYNLPVGTGAPTATIVHDVAFLRVPETFAPAQRLRLRWSIRRSVARSAAVVTVSEFSKAEMLDCYPGLDAEAVVVAPNAAGEAYFHEPAPSRLSEVRDRYQLPGQFVLGVGNIQPRKNLATAARAAQRCGVPLVVAGRRHGRADDLDGLPIKWLGYVPGADLVALYRLASVFCYVSLYEGFGLPVIEALAAGAVVVTSSRSALPEVAGDAAVLADPTSLDAVAHALETALGDDQLRARLARAGPLRARHYSWADSGASVLDCLRDLRR